jgi:hypothetical protein
MGVAGSVSGDSQAVGREGDSLSPAKFLTKICMVSMGSVEEARELDVEETILMSLEGAEVWFGLVIKGDAGSCFVYM